jgi:hypothetical protein
MESPPTEDTPWKKFQKLRYALPYIYFVYAFLFEWEGTTDCYCRLFVINFVLMHILVLHLKSLYNFDSLMILLFFLWIVENDNEETGDCLDYKDDYFLVFTLGFFKGALWAMSFFMFVGTAFIIVLLIKDIVYRVRTRDMGTININGLTSEEISTLPREKYCKEAKKAEEKSDETNNEVCAICLSDFEQNEILIKLTECHHRFHENCLTTWIMKNVFCPYCRRDLRNPNKHVDGTDSVRIEITNLESSANQNTESAEPTLRPPHQISGYQELDNHVVLGNSSDHFPIELTERN